MRRELPHNAPLPADGEESLKTALERGFAAMATFSLDCFLMSELFPQNMPLSQLFLTIWMYRLSTQQDSRGVC